MSKYEADKEYDVTIDGTALIESKAKGTKGLEFRLENQQCGIIYHTLWLTATTKKRTAEILEEFGVTAADLRTAEFWEYPEKKLDGQTARITTEANEYNGKTTVKVKWFNGAGKRPMKSAGPEAASAVALMFADHTADDAVPF